MAEKYDQSRCFSCNHYNHCVHVYPKPTNTAWPTFLSFYFTRSACIAVTCKNTWFQSHQFLIFLLSTKHTSAVVKWCWKGLHNQIVLHNQMESEVSDLCEATVECKEFDIRIFSDETDHNTGLIIVGAILSFLVGFILCFLISRTCARKILLERVRNRLRHLFSRVDCLRFRPRL